MPPEAPSETLNPYPGLRPFQSDEDYLFFGREEQVAELLGLLRSHRFVAVVGTSGSGKSSLVRCGLLSELQGGSMVDAGPHWDVAVMQPGGDPLKYLAQALCEADLYDGSDPTSVPQVLATLTRSLRGLVEAVRQSNLEAGSNLVLVVDQFEEIFRFHEAGKKGLEQAPDFIKLLLTACSQTEVPVYVVLTMRSDFLGDCSQFSGLAKAVNDGEYLIPRLSREQLRAAIEGPARVAGGEISRRLVQRLLNDLGGEEDQLPILQHALMRTWDRWSREHGNEEPVDLRHYEAVGEMREALSRHADEVLESLTGEGDERVVERIFKALTEKGADGRGIRRPTRLGDLCAIADADGATVARVLDAYRRPGVTFVMPPAGPPLRPDTVVDISHESLMRIWNRLRSWVEDDAQSARVYRRLLETARLWRDGKAGLYHDPDLSIAQAWRETHQPNRAWASLYGGGFDAAVAFLDASHHQARREEREREEARRRELDQAKLLAEARARSAKNFQRFALGMGVVAAVAVAAFIFALVKRNEAIEARELAVTAQREAEASAMEARDAREALRLEFTRSDQSLARTFVDDGMTGRAIAHLARSLKPEYAPDNPATIDRVFYLLAYLAPPRYRTPPLDYGGNLLYDSDATADASLVVTGVWANEDVPEVRVWVPGSPQPIIAPGRNVWQRSLAFSPDGRFLFIGCTGGRRGYVVDTSTWERVRRVPQTGITSARYSADGKRILTGSHNDRRAVVWDAATGEVIFETPSRAVFPAWSPDETRIALGQHRAGDVVSVLDPATGGIEDLAHEGSPVQGIAVWSPDGRRLLTRTGGDRGNAKLWVWDVAGEPIGQRKPLFSIAHEAVAVDPGEPRYFAEPAGNVYTVGAFTPDGQRILTAGTDRTVRIWDAADGTLLDSQPLDPLVGRDGIPLFSADGRRVMLECRDGRCWYADFDPGAETVPALGAPRPLNEGYAFLADSGTMKPLLLPHDDVTAAAVVPGGRAVVLGSARGAAALYHTATGERQGALLRHAGEIGALAVSGDGTKIATGSSLGTIRVWNAATSQPLSPVLGVVDPALDGIRGLAFASGGKELTVFAPTGVTVWDAASGERLRDVRVPDVSAGPPDAWGAASDDGELLATVAGHRVAVDHRSSGERVCEIAHDGAVTAVAFSTDRSLVATASQDPRHTVRVWAVATGEPVGPALAHDSTVLSLAFRDDGGALVAGCTSRRAHLWGVPSGESLDRLPITGAGRCTRAVFSPCGRMVATAFENGAGSFAQVWESETGRRVTGPLATGAAISDLVFLDDGGRLLVWPERGVAGVAAVWDVSVSGGEPGPEWFPEAAEALGGTRLDSESNPVAIDDPGPEYDRIRQLPGESRLERFVQWLLEFPGTRSRSPFRPRSSEAYISNLAESSTFELLEEAARLAPHNARALALRASVRPGLAARPGAQTLSRADLIRARVLAPGDPAVSWCEGIALERMGEDEAADRAYARARGVGPLDDSALKALVAIQERFAAREPERRHLLGAAMASAESERGSEGKVEAVHLRVKRFLLAVENQNFEGARQDWEILKEVAPHPAGIDFGSLLKAFLTAAEDEADRLAAAGEWDQAIALASPVALVAEMEKPTTGEPGDDVSWDTTAVLAKLVEWGNRDDPPLELVPRGSDWKFLDDGSDAGSAWREPGFDDAAWDHGPARLGYGDGNERTTVSFGPDRQNKFVTTYFRTRFAVPESAEIRSVYIDLVRDDGAVVYINGDEVLRDNMPAGPVTHDVLAATRVGGTEESRAFRFPVDPAVLRPGENSIAAEIHQRERGSSDLGFDLRLVASGHSPARFLETHLTGELGAGLRARATDLVPLPRRAEWTRDFGFVIGPTIGDGAEAVPDGSWVRRFGFQASMGRWENALATADRRLAALAGTAAPAGQRQTKEWLKRKELALVRLHRPAAEIEAVRDEIFAVPPRDPSRDPKQLDLTQYYNASLYDNRAWVKSANRINQLGGMAESFVPRKGVSFDIRGVIQLESGALPNGNTFNGMYGHRYPERVEGIAVGQKSPAVHFLVSCQWGRAGAGDEVAEFVMRYDDGSSREMMARFIEDVSDWYAIPGNTVPPERIGWHGWIGAQSQQEIVISELVWENPYPDKTIRSIDFISTLGAAAPFVIAITLE